MKILFLGVGSAFCPPDLYQSNLMLFSDNGSGNTLLLDCGGDIRFSLAEHGMNSCDLKNIYVSHLHADHIGGLEYVALTTYFIPGVRRPKLYCVGGLMTRLWRSLKGGLETLEDQPAKLSNFFEPITLSVGKTFEWEEFIIKPTQTLHVLSDCRQMENYGLQIYDKISGKTVFWPSDTQYSPEKYMNLLYESADLILHDCETTPMSQRSGVHAHFTQLCALPLAYKQKMILYHYTPNYINYSAKEQGFIGYAKKGQVIWVHQDGTIDYDATLDEDL